MNVLIITLVLFGIGLLAAIAIAIWAYNRNRQTNELRSKFGSEYDRTIRSEGDLRAGEKILHERKERVEKLDIKPLSAAQRDNFAQAWGKEQARFVDEPRTAVINADRLVKEVMEARGYPMSKFDQRVADVSVDHPGVVQNYRAAHDIAIRNERGQVSTEDYRKAMIHYRALFAELLSDDQSDVVEREHRVRAA